jgi:hypothetical protein
MTRLYMDFLRMEGESNFLALLPVDSRKKLLSQWYQKASPELTDYLEGDINDFNQASGIEYATSSPQLELYSMLAEHLAEVQPSTNVFESNLLSDKQLNTLATINRLPAKQATILPETTIVVVQDDEKPDKIDVFTILRNSAHFNVNSLFEEDENRNIAQDSLTIVHGILGSYPDAIWQLKASQIEETVAQLYAIQNESDYKALMDNVGIRRTHPNFWSFSDKLLSWFETHNVVDGGLLDYNRLEDR